MKNLSQTILTQYSSSQILNQILSTLNGNLDPAADLRLFYDQIWNIATATGYGLDVWGRIVGVSRNLAVPQTFNYFGFEEATGTQPFGSGVFYNGGGLGGTTIITLSDAAFRTLILLKARANISNCSAQSINSILASLFGDQGACYAVDNGNMTYTLTFRFVLTPTDFTLIAQAGVLPRPAGVSFTIVQGF